ncbi:DUF3611 family protein [Lyngbya aestuarii]|uniref:DUF3611 family protein n=1 Tax=Lyngbya aestuarii TaxID=118322 RepID=UPI00403DB308
MQTKLDSTSPTPEIKDIAANFRLVGLLGFWVQLGLGVVSFLCLLFAWSGRNFSEETHQGMGVSIFFAVCGVIALGISIYFAWRYTRIAKSLGNSNPGLRPSKSDTIALLRLGLITTFAGIFLNLLGAGASLGVQVAKAVSQPPGVAITDPDMIIRALDVFVSVANVDGIAAHFVGAICSLWLLERVNQH